MPQSPQPAGDEGFMDLTRGPRRARHQAPVMPAPEAAAPGNQQEIYDPDEDLRRAGAPWDREHPRGEL